MILCRINKGVYLCLFEHANARKHVYEYSCSSVRVFLNIYSSSFSSFSCLFFLIWNAINKKMIWYIFERANTRKYVREYSCSSVRVFLSILAHLAHLAQSFFSDFECDKWINVLIHVWACKYKKACQGV